MTSLVSSTSSLFLPLSQLNPYCAKLKNSLNDGGRTSQKDRLIYEQTLWNEVKKLRALNNKSIFSYLIGYYHTILHQLTLNKQTSSFNQCDYEIYYHVLIRVGDLHRYLERVDLAFYYYSVARNLFPQFGHAYNQLGLLTEPSKCYKCCYFYARAANSSKKPLNTIAESNLRIAISKYNCKLVNEILSCDTNVGESCVEIEDVDNLGEASPQIDRIFPRSASEWFYSMVVAIYGDNIQPIAKPFLVQLVKRLSNSRVNAIKDSIQKATLSNSRDKDLYILLSSLDILLDWLKLGSQSNSICQTIGDSLLQVRTQLHSIIVSCKSLDSYQNAIINDSFCSTNSSKTTVIERNSSLETARGIKPGCQDSNHSSFTNSSHSSEMSLISKQPALPHDYVLRGFRSLDKIHQGLLFDSSMRSRIEVNECSFIDEEISNQIGLIELKFLVRLMVRVKSKIDSFGTLIRKRTRNIALESILSNLDKSDESMNKQL